MFISERIIFLELQKTGCTHIRNLLKEFVGGRFVERHNQAEAHLFSGNRVFMGAVRDPWAWYLSVWAYSCDRKGDHYSNVSTPGIRLRNRGWRLHPFSLLVDVLQSRPNRHPEQWRRTFRDVNDAGAFRAWLYMLNDERYWPDVGEGYWRFPLNRFAGFLTYRYLRLFTCRKGELGKLGQVSTAGQLVEYDRRDCFIDHFIRNESLESDLLDALRQAGVEVPQDAAAGLAARPKTNTSSKRRGVQDYYDAATEKLVGERDRLIIDKFGYVAPSLRHSCHTRQWVTADTARQTG
jgi:hypothetical protein